MKKTAAVVLTLCLMTVLSSCGEKKTLHCDNCGKEVTVSADSNMTEDWIVYCSDCEKELGLDNVVETESFDIPTE